MANDRTRSGNPTNDLPELTRQVRPVEEGRQPATLASRLVPIADRIRQLYTRFGIRPYRVFLVHVFYGGARVGEGEPAEISRREILPTPRVRDMSATTEILRPIGLVEEGGVVVDQISPRFTEDDLMGRTPDLQNPSLPRTGLRNTAFYWEVVENRPSDPRSPRRRYVPSSVPALSRDGFQWQVSLTKQDYDRGRLGGSNPRVQH